MASNLPKPPEDKEFQNHDPSAVPAIMGPHKETCGAPTELRHDHPIFGDDIRWHCTRSMGHLGRHAAVQGPGLAASWARKI